MDKTTVWNPDALKAARRIFGHSQEKAARNMGISWATVQRWEKGKVVPRGLYMDRVVDYIKEAKKFEEKNNG